MEDGMAFGDLLRDLRISHGERQLDLARATGKDITFISAIEAGRKKVPAGLLEEIINHYDQAGENAERLRRLAAVSHRLLKVRLDGASKRHREVLGMYARKFSSLSDVQLKQVRRILEGGMR